MAWFRMAAQQGHPQSSYNLAIGHLSGMKTDLEVCFVHTQKIDNITDIKKYFLLIMQNDKLFALFYDFR